MEKRDVTHALREMLREQVCCIGRVAARHQIPDDAVWEIAKGFEILYRRACRQVHASSEEPDSTPVTRRAEPHPGLTHLLNELDREEADSSRVCSGLHHGAIGTGCRQEQLGEAHDQLTQS